VSWRLTIVVLLAALAGCRGDPPLESRYQAAAQLSDRYERDDSLRQIALDATRQGRAEIADKAIDGMTRGSLRDDTAQWCAEGFDRQHRRDLAVAFVRKIDNGPRREALMRSLAAP